MTDKFDSFYLDIANRTSQLSYCRRLKVGAVLVKDRRIISFGFNGTIPKFPNVCEDIDGKTLDTVIHAEENAILKVAQSHDTTIGSTLYCTHAPCPTCSRLIISAGVLRVVYSEVYKTSEGLEMMIAAGIELEKL